MKQSKLRYIYYRLKLLFAKTYRLSSVLTMSSKTQVLLKSHILINNCVELRNCILGLTLTQGTGFFLQIWHFCCFPRIQNLDWIIWIIGNYRLGIASPNLIKSAIAMLTSKIKVMLKAEPNPQFWVAPKNWL